VTRDIPNSSDGKRGENETRKKATSGTIEEGFQGGEDSSIKMTPNENVLLFSQNIPEK